MNKTNKILETVGIVFGVMLLIVMCAFVLTRANKGESKDTQVSTVTTENIQTVFSYGDLDIKADFTDYKLGDISIKLIIDNKTGKNLVLTLNDNGTASSLYQKANNGQVTESILTTPGTDNTSITLKIYDESYEMSVVTTQITFSSLSTNPFVTAGDIDTENSVGIEYLYSDTKIEDSTNDNTDDSSESIFNDEGNTELTEGESSSNEESIFDD